MALAKTKRARANRRGSAEAVEKRRAGRRFNDLLSGGAAQGDGRTEKRRARMLEELRTGQLRASGRELKPLDVLVRVDALLGLGETLASIRKAMKPPRPIPPTDEIVETVRRLHEAYGFNPSSYAFAGIDVGVLKRAGIRERGPGGGKRTQSGTRRAA
jgi:hypothetical protein